MQISTTNAYCEGGLVFVVILVSVRSQKANWPRHKSHLLSERSVSVILMNHFTLKRISKLSYDGLLIFSNLSNSDSKIFKSSSTILSSTIRCEATLSSSVAANIGTDVT